MSVRRIAALLALAAALPVTALAVAPAAQAKTTCDNAPGRTMAVDQSGARDLRVFQTITRAKSDSSRSTLRIYVCTSGRKSARQIARFNSTLDLQYVLLTAKFAGTRHVALEMEALGGVSASHSVALFNIQQAAPVATFIDEDLSGKIPFVTTRSGGIARIGPTGALLVHDAAGTRTLAPAMVTDLASGGDTIYFRVADKVQSAVLTGAAASN